MDTPHFAAIWRPAENGWPASYAILTIDANPDIEPVFHRQNAVILSKDRVAWLDHLEPQEQLLRPLPAFTFALEQTEGRPIDLHAKRRQAAFSL